MVLLFYAFCSLLLAVTGCFAEPCREGAKYSNAIIALSPNVKTTKILSVPRASTIADCLAACCDLPGCDLAWVFEARCYIVNCQHKENCEPKKTSVVESYLAFVERSSQKSVLQTLHEQSLRNWNHLAEIQGYSDEEDMSLFDKDHSLSELPLAGKYPEDYGALASDISLLNTKHELTETPDYVRWHQQVRADGIRNLSMLDTGETDGSSSDTVSGGTSSVGGIRNYSQQKQTVENITEIGPASTKSTIFPLGNNVGEAANKNMKVGEGMKKEGLISSVDLKPVMLESPSPVYEDSHTFLSVQRTFVQEVITPPSTSIHVSFPKDVTTHSSTTKPTVFKALPLTGDIKEISLPQNEVITDASVAPKPTTAEKAVRVNQLPVAIISPESQDISQPDTLVIINGSQSTDDEQIVTYHWELLRGRLQEKEILNDSPVLRLFSLLPGNYTFRLTVIDSDGAANSTTATVMVRKPVDYPPVANAGPDQKIALPLNYLTLNGNHSTDDHQVMNYKWSLSPRSKRKEVEMQGIETPFLQLTGLQEGNYTFLLTVTDSSGQQSTDEVTVTVQPVAKIPPVSVTGPDKHLLLPVENLTLDGSRSTDDVGIVSYFWESISSPAPVYIEKPYQAITSVSGLQPGVYCFRLTVKDAQGLTDTATLNVDIREDNRPPKARAGGSRILVLPNSSIILDGSKSVDDQGIVSYIWIKDGKSPAAGEVLYGSDNYAQLQLTSLVEGNYIFHLKVTDSQGNSDTDTATVQVRPDPKKNDLVEMILEVSLNIVTEEQKQTLVQQLAVLLNVLESDIKVQAMHAHSDLSTKIILDFQSGNPYRALRGRDVARRLQAQLLRERTDFLFTVLRVDTVVCHLKCSDHGRCDPITKRCLCYPFWMENLIQLYFYDAESNCDWSVLYVIILAFTALLILVGILWLCISCCKSRKRTKVRKKTKYTILDNFDDQERMELRPKYGIKHRSTAHNSSLMVSESEFDSDQDTVFSKQKNDSDSPAKDINGSIRNGTSFNFHCKEG